jgi:hypothetical protein
VQYGRWPIAVDAGGPPAGEPVRASEVQWKALAWAEVDDAPFSGSDDLKAWVVQGLDELT